MKKFLKIIISLVLVVGLGIGIYFLVKPNQEATSVMSLSVNPDVQLVLDQNGKVMHVNAQNADGEKITLNVNFIGKTADEAAKLFVEASTNANYINFGTPGTTVTINIACEDETNEKIKELQTKIKNSVNNYFKETGIIAGAVVDITENYIDEIKSLGVKAEELADKTFDEAMKIMSNTSKDVKNIALSLRNTLFDQLDTLKASFDALFENEELIANYKKQLEDSSLSEFEKVIIKGFLNAAQEIYNELKPQFDAQYEEIKKALIEQSQSILAEIETAINTAIENGKTLVLEHKEAFENSINKESIIAQIEAFQNSLA